MESLAPNQLLLGTPGIPSNVKAAMQIISPKSAVNRRKPLKAEKPRCGGAEETWNMSWSPDPFRKWTWQWISISVFDYQIMISLSSHNFGESRCPLKSNWELNITKHESIHAAERRLSEGIAWPTIWVSLSRFWFFSMDTLWLWLP